MDSNRKTSTAASADHSVPEDLLVGLVSRDQQRQAARLAQDAFATAFRLSVEAGDEDRTQGVNQLVEALRNWGQATDDVAARGLRLALIIFGLDQWGVAYSRAFSLQAIPALSAVVGALRTGLDAGDDAHFLRQFEAVGAGEGNVIDFKIDLRRGIHLALWHAMIACDERGAAETILSNLGGMMVALTREMPQLGWRLVADAIAHIQIQCLAGSFATEGLAQEMTENLFAALSRELPAECRDLVMAHAARSVLAWQQANRPASGSIH